MASPSSSPSGRYYLEPFPISTTASFEGNHLDNSDRSEDDDILTDPRLNMLATNYLWNENDPTRLTSKQVRESWGTWTEFMLSYGLKPDNQSDLEQALAISRALKRAERR